MGGMSWIRREIQQPQDVVRDTEDEVEGHFARIEVRRDMRHR